MAYRVTYVVDPLARGNDRGRINRRKNNLRIIIPGEWGIISDVPSEIHDLADEDYDAYTQAVAALPGNTFATQNAVKTVERIAALANISGKLRKKAFIEIANAIMLMYFSYYHHALVLYHGTYTEEEPTFGDLGDTAVRDAFADFGDRLRNLLGRLHKHVVMDEIMGWEVFYDENHNLDDAHYYE